MSAVVWRTEPIMASGNKQTDIALHADIEIPDRIFKMRVFRKAARSSRYCRI